MIASSSFSGADLKCFKGFVVVDGDEAVGYNGVDVADITCADNFDVDETTILLIDAILQIAKISMRIKKSARIEEIMLTN